MLPTACAKDCSLHGILQIAGQRSFTFSLDNADISLVCKTFWKAEVLLIPFSENGVNFTENFTVLNSNQFLEKVQNNCLNIEVSKMENNLNPEVVGFLRLPLHQFYIAYRDATLTNRLNNEQFPVISTNKWMPVLSPISGEQIGEIECLLAIGTAKQIVNIENLKKHSTKSTAIEPTAQEQGSNLINSKTSDLINILQNSLDSTSPYKSYVQPDKQMTESSFFRIVLEIKCARNLPLTQTLKLKKKIKRSFHIKGVQNLGGEEPSTYVTFQAIDCDAKMVKSHEGMVFTTTVIEKNSNPVWNVVFCISGSMKYLINKNERFILKVWKKVTKGNAQDQNLPNPMEDSIIGFASIGLCDLIENSPVLNGWFDIMDFSGNINGQIHVVVKPFDDIKKLKELVRNFQVENLLGTFESTLDLNNMNLCRAIKRKFTELEEISERLRIRLLDVTSSTESCKIAREISDEQLEEFEHDLNTSVCEDENDSFSFHKNSS